MRMMLSGLGLLSLATWLLCGSSASAAVSPVQSQSIAPAYAVWGPNTTFQGAPLVFDKFDPALGTLQSVNVTVSYSFTNKVSMTFTNPSSPQTISLMTALPQSPTVGPTITLNDPSSSPLSTLLTVSAPVVTYTRTYGGPGQTASQTFSNNPNQFATNSPFFLTPDGQPNNTSSTFTGTRTLTLTNPSQLAFFLGSGNFVLPASASFGATNREIGNNDFGSLITYAGLSFQLSYTYVPEPPSVALLGLGTGGLLLAGKWRRRRLAV